MPDAEIVPGPWPDWRHEVPELPSEAELVGMMTLEELLEFQRTGVAWVDLERGTDC